MYNFLYKNLEIGLADSLYIKIHQNSQIIESNLPEPILHLWKEMLSGIIDKMRATIKGQFKAPDKDIIREFPLPNAICVVVINLQSQNIKFILKSNFEVSTILYYEEIVTLRSLIESLCFSLPVIISLSKINLNESKITKNVTKEKPIQIENQNSVEITNQTNVPQEQKKSENNSMINIDSIPKIIEIANVLLTIDIKKISSNEINQLKQIIKEYCNMDINASNDAIIGYITNIKEIIEKDVKENTIDLKIPHLKENIYCSEILKGIETMNKSEKIKRIIGALFIKEIVSVFSMLDSMGDLVSQNN